MRNSFTLFLLSPLLCPQICNGPISAHYLILCY
uniref:Uncharacterized protein n=1 Tax=Anguilla anguilla TaxID=7936 RepID=A0A0E9SYD6_ANGAN